MLRSIDRHDNMVITTTSVTKCIFLNFGAILKRMVKLAKQFRKLKQKLACRIHMIYIYLHLLPLPLPLIYYLHYLPLIYYLHKKKQL